MNIPIPGLNQWPIKVDILRRRDLSYEPVEDRARVIDVNGADYYELKGAKMGQGKNVRLKAADFSNLLPKNKLIVFELNRGQFTASRIELRTRYDSQGRVLKRQIDVKQKDGTTKPVMVEDYEAVIVPVIDGNADIVHVENITTLAELTASPGWVEKYGWLIGMISVAVIVTAGMWFVGNGLTAAASSNVYSAQEWSRVANATQALAVCRGLLEHAIPTFVP